MVGERLQQLVESIEQLERELAGLRTRNPALKDAYAAERRSVQEDLRRVWGEAETAGFSVEALREVIRLRAIPPARRAELEASVSVYRQALGM
ncbi:GapR family DNA-binding domain-containing protein [Azospirillum sp. OGB3]|uniref:GapR family DNA-binding domain-containing protein n=1 Tax=Azospirillum sp. OGB3 TaxID=2587012 RepID=UPI00160582DE|nr:GapR family DNA-binding domain-containing protein [Azospirillum sp. OGB3]